MNENGNGEKYGVLVYDIPDEHATLAANIRRKIRPHALRVNLSVYLMPWNKRHLIGGLIEKAEEKTGMTTNSIRMLEFAEAELGEIREMAREGLRDFIEGIKETTEESAEKIRAKSETEIPNRIQVDLLKRLEDAKSLMMAFHLSGDLDFALEASREIVAANISRETYERLNKSIKFQSRAEVIVDLVPSDWNGVAVTV